MLLNKQREIIAPVRPITYKVEYGSFNNDGFTIDVDMGFEPKETIIFPISGENENNK